MTDHDGFERRLEARLLAHVAVGDRPFDIDTVTRATIARAGSVGTLGRLRSLDGVAAQRWVLPRRPWLVAILATLVLLALAGAATLIGSLPDQRGPNLPTAVVPGMFVPAGKGVVDRHDLWTATLLDDGHVLFVGGSSSQGQDTTEVWNPATMTFTAGEPMVIGR